MRERKGRPRLRVIAGGGAEAGTARGGEPSDQVSDARASGPGGDEASSSLLLPAVELSLRSASDARDEEFCPRYYEGQHEQRRIAADVDRLRYAIVDLAAIELPSSRLLAELNPTFDRPIIRDRLIRAIDCLSQFAEEWRLEELTEAARSSRRTREDDAD